MNRGTSICFIELLLMAGGCFARPVDVDEEDCQVGLLGCECYGNQTCDAELECVQDRCQISFGTTASATTMGGAEANGELSTGPELASTSSSNTGSQFETTAQTSTILHRDVTESGTGSGSGDVQEVSSSSTGAVDCFAYGDCACSAQGACDETASTSGIATTRPAGESTDETSSTGEETSWSAGATGDPPSCDADTVFIAAGNFLDNGTGARRTVAPVCLDRAEVTVAQYEACVRQEICIMPTTYIASASYNYGAPGRDDYPVNGVSWEDAQTYCTWRGRRLPTEWEWEWAARGREAANLYPWGDAPEPNCDLAVMYDVTVGYGCGQGAAHPVGSKSPEGDTIDGAQDMAGNLWEWTDSFYSGTIGNRVMRGGDWNDGDIAYFRVDHRLGNAANYRSAGVGFRCVRAAG